MDREFYIQEAERILKDENTYIKLSKDPTKEFRVEIVKFLQEGREIGILTEDELNYLKN